MWGVDTVLSVGPRIGGFLAKNEIQKLELSHQEEVTTLRTELSATRSSIERRVGAGEELLDVRNLLVGPQQITRALPDSQFFPTDDFYALMPDESSGWAYEQTTEAKIMGLDEEQVASIPHLDIVPLHVWHRDESFALEEGSVWSSVMLQRYPHGTALEVLELGLRANPAVANAVEQDSEEDQEKMFNDVLTYLREVYREDAAGLFLTFTLQQELAPPQTMLRSIQKKGRIAYAQMT